MLISRSSVEAVIDQLSRQTVLSLDTETTGLKPHHGDRLFSIIIANQKEEFYFNFNWAQQRENISRQTLYETDLKMLNRWLFSDPSKEWFMHNAKFDLTFLEESGCDIKGEVHCTQAIGRVCYNDHLKYSLEASGERIGFPKDNTVEKYIQDNGLFEKIQKPGKKQTFKNKFFHKVPLNIIQPYGDRDARVTYELGKSQIQELEEEPVRGKLPSMRNIANNETKLIRTVNEMERVGVKIDRDYCVRATRYENDRAEKAIHGFKKHTGKDFISSGKLFAEIFKSEESKWGWTKKGNPSFGSEFLRHFENPAAKEVVAYREAKSKADFYQGFLWHADSNDVVHPNFNQGGAATGRFTSSDPNFQNLKKDEDEELEKEFCVRRAIVPRPGFTFIMPDYDQMEYRLMMDYACNAAGRLTKLGKMIQSGHDVHQATADLVTEMGGDLKRKRAKNGNFATLYGSGIKTLAKTIKGTETEARELKINIFAAAPEINTFVRQVQGAVVRRKFIKNWAGRVSHFPDPRWAYKGPNYLIQGGCADYVKFAMVEIGEYLRDKKSRMIMTIHDELVFEIHESELNFVPKRINEIMQNQFLFKYIQLTASMEWSDVSLADKKKGFPV